MNRKILGYIAAYLDHGRWFHWTELTNEELAGYFVYLYGTAQNGEIVRGDWRANYPGREFDGFGDPRMSEIADLIDDAIADAEAA